MKFKPNYLVHSMASDMGKSQFTLNYFNGRFVVSMNNWAVLSMLGANWRASDRFNFVISTFLDEQAIAKINPLFGEEQSVLREQLKTGVLFLNPQATSLFVQMITRGRPDVNLIYNFECNWKGIEILAEVCREDLDTVTKAIAKRIDTLLTELRAKRAEWERNNWDGSLEKDEDDSPQPYGRNL